MGREGRELSASTASGREGSHFHLLFTTCPPHRGTLQSFLSGLIQQSCLILIHFRRQDTIWVQSEFLTW